MGGRVWEGGGKVTREIGLVSIGERETMGQMGLRKPNIRRGLIDEETALFQSLSGFCHFFGLRVLLSQNMEEAQVHKFFLESIDS